MTVDPVPPDHPMLTPVLLFRELVRGRSDHREVQRRVDRGELVKVRFGAYVAGSDWRLLDRDGRHVVRARAVARQAKARVVLSHTAALPWWDVTTWGFDLTDVHVTRLDGRSGRGAAGVRQHKSHLAVDDWVRRGDVLVTSPTRTALDVTMLGRTEPALCAVNGLLQRGLTSEAALMERYSRSEPGHPRGMRHWPHSLPTEHILRLADPRIESVAESRAFHLIWHAGLPMPVPQWVVVDEQGHVIKRVDFAWPDLGVFLEINGRVKLTDPLRAGESPVEAVMRERRLLEQVVVHTGWHCLQWDWMDLERPASTARRLRQVLEVARAAA